MLSVLVVSPHPSVPGGVSTFIECMKKHVRSSRIDSFFVGSVGVGAESAVKTVWRLFFVPVRLAAHVLKTKPDVVHINPSFDIKSLVRDGLLVLALRVVGYRHIFLYFHGWDLGVQQKILGSPVLRVLAGFVFNLACLITVLGTEFRDGLVQLGVKPTRIQLTHTMYDGDILAQVAGEPSLHRRAYILFLSRFDQEKGGRELIQAFAALAADYPEMDLVMAGDGAEAAAWKNLAVEYRLQNRIVFTGYVGGVNKGRLLRDCMIFALPTYYRSEGMPVAVLEAMGAGKPLLVGSAGALRSIVSEPENGIIVQAVTAQTVEKGLRQLLQNPAQSAVIGQHNAEIAAAKFEAAIVTAEVEKFTQQVAAC